MTKTADNTAKETPRIPARDLFTQLLNEHNLIITQTPLEEDIKRISDGSIIITRPTVSVRYRDE